jgi:hypothetical protein
MVGGGTRGYRAGVYLGQVSLNDRQASGRGPHPHRGELVVLDEQELLVAQLPRLGRAASRGGEWSPEAMGGAAARLLP